jgi:hypothetical protein
MRAVFSGSKALDDQRVCLRVELILPCYDNVPITQALSINVMISNR